MEWHGAGRKGAPKQTQRRCSKRSAKSLRARKCTDNAPRQLGKGFMGPLPGISALASLSANVLRTTAPWVSAPIRQAQRTRASRSATVLRLLAWPPRQPGPASRPFFGARAHATQRCEPPPVLHCLNMPNCTAIGTPLFGSHASISCAHPDMNVLLFYCVNIHIML